MQIRYNLQLERITTKRASGIQKSSMEYLKVRFFDKFCKRPKFKFQKNVSSMAVHPNTKISSDMLQKPFRFIFILIMMRRNQRGILPWWKEGFHDVYYDLVYFRPNFFYQIFLHFWAKTQFVTEKLFFGQKIIFGGKNHFLGKKSFFWEKIIFGEKKQFWPTKSFWAEKIIFVRKNHLWPEKLFLSKQILGEKIILGRTKRFLVEQKHFQEKINIFRRKFLYKIMS